MKLINTTNGITLAVDVEVASTFTARLKGLMGRKTLHSGEAFVLLPCNSVHTFFMHFPIDVLFVNKEAVVLRILENMKPFRVSPLVPQSYMVVELPSGQLAATSTRIGHHLQLSTRRKQHEN